MAGYRKETGQAPAQGRVRIPLRREPSVLPRHKENFLRERLKSYGEIFFTKTAICQ